MTKIKCSELRREFSHSNLSCIVAIVDKRLPLVTNSLDVTFNRNDIWRFTANTLSRVVGRRGLDLYQDERRLLRYLAASETP